MLRCAARRARARPGGTRLRCPGRRGLDRAAVRPHRRRVGARRRHEPVGGLRPGAAGADVPADPGHLLSRDRAHAHGRRARPSRAGRGRAGRPGRRDRRLRRGRRPRQALPGHLTPARPGAGASGTAREAREAGHARAARDAHAPRRDAALLRRPSGARRADRLPRLGAALRPQRARPGVLPARRRPERDAVGLAGRGAEGAGDRDAVVHRVQPRHEPGQALRRLRRHALPGLRRRRGRELDGVGGGSSHLRRDPRVRRRRRADAVLLVVRRADGELARRVRHGGAVPSGRRRSLGRRLAAPRLGAARADCPRPGGRVRAPLSGHRRDRGVRRDPAGAGRAQAGRRAHRELRPARGA